MSDYEVASKQEKIPLVSVIIPTYNAEVTLKACLESISRQTFANYEILIIDGLSSDGTLSIVKDFASTDNRFRWISEKDNGIYDAMNKGVGMAKGEWLYFLGSDDELYDETVFGFFFNTNKLKDLIMLYGKALVVPNNFITTINMEFNQLLKYNLCHQAIFYSKDVFKKYRYNDRFKALGDWDLNLKLYGRYGEDKIKGYDKIVCKFLNQGVSSDWKNSDEYRSNFRGQTKMSWRYLSFTKFLYRMFRKGINRVRSVAVSKMHLAK